MELKEIFRSHFPRTDYPAGFPSRIIKPAATLLKNKGQTACIDFLKKNYTPNYVRRDFDPSAICNIVASSKPIEEFEISKYSVLIQEKIYSAKEGDEKALKVGTSKEDHMRWFEENELETPSNYGIQLYNQLFKNAINIRKGIEVKAQNAYDKKTKRINAKNLLLKQKGKELISLPEKPKVVNDDGFLIQKPGINHSLFAAQQSNLRHLKEAGIIALLPEEYRGYARDSKTSITSSRYYDRLSIEKGKPQFIREKDKVVLYKPETTLFRSKRRKNGKNKGEPILLVINFGKDWIVFDGRGMLRDLRQRHSKKQLSCSFKELSIDGMLEFFTGDPVVYLEMGKVRVSYREGVLTHKTRELMSTKSGHKLIGKLLEEGKTPVIISCDVGKTNPLAYGVDEITKDGQSRVKSGLLSDEDTKSLSVIKSKLDELEKELELQAIEKLSPEHQEIIRSYDPVEQAKKNCAEKHDLPESFPWDQITGHSERIAEHLISIGRAAETIHNKETGAIIRDGSYAHKAKPKLPEEVRKALNEAKWEEQRTSSRYVQITKRRTELVRSIVNKLYNDTLLLGEFKEKNIEAIFNVETLSVFGGFFDGGGKREAGWANLFKPKSEDRWVIKPFLKAIKDLPKNKGVYVAESFHHFTSQTCPKCQHCCRENRNGEHFKCLKCGYYGNADKDVATHNLTTVLRTGKRLPGGERSPDEKKPKTARKKLTSRKEKEKAAVFQGERETGLPLPFDPLANRSATA